MTKPVSLLMLVAIVLSALAVGGCMAPPEPVPEGATWLAEPRKLADPGTLRVVAGSDRVATPGEVFWLPVEVTGGTLPYAFTWMTCSVCPGGRKPLICNGDTSTACVTVYNTCRLRVIVTDGIGESVTAEVGVTVPR